MSSPEPTLSIDELRAVLQQSPAEGRFVVAFSGGADSTALLHAAASLRGTPAVSALRAVHIDHRLRRESGDWAEHCRTFCNRLRVPLTVHSVSVPRSGSQGLEAAARMARYGALESLLSDGEGLLTAHHRDDQVETLLLRLLRGAGPRGLSGMPASRPFGPGWLIRPLLTVPRSALLAYLRRDGLRWIDDPGNSDPCFDRNFLRTRVIPLLQTRWPGLEVTLERATRHQSSARDLMASLAAVDLEKASGTRPATLDCAFAMQLDEARLHNLLRAWLEHLGLNAPQESQLERIVTEVIAAGEGKSPLLSWPGVEVRRYRGLLYAMRPLGPEPDRSMRLEWHPSRTLNLPSGSIRASAVTGCGLSAALVGDGGCEIRYRQGGERCRPAGRVGSHPLKKLFQERSVPPWLRPRVPLIYLDGRLAAVAGVFVCEGFQARSGEPGWRVSWSEQGRPEEESA